MTLSPRGKRGKIDLVIDLPKNYQEEKPPNECIIRRTAVDLAIPLFTNVQLARRFVEAISRKTLADLQIKIWKEYRGTMKTWAIRNAGRPALNPMGTGGTGPSLRHLLTAWHVSWLSPGVGIGVVKIMGAAMIDDFGGPGRLLIPRRGQS